MPTIIAPMRARRAQFCSQNATGAFGHGYTSRIMQRPMKPEELRQERLTSRGSHHRTQSNLAETLGVAANTVARWERGDLPIPKWVDQTIALMRRLDRTELALERERAKTRRLKTRLESEKPDRKRVAPRKRS
jgi:DNA-binding transcriptional regulator YiaG